jgi:hypothetical protein
MSKYPAPQTWLYQMFWEFIASVSVKTISEPIKLWHGGDWMVAIMTPHINIQILCILFHMLRSDILKVMSMKVADF